VDPKKIRTFSATSTTVARGGLEIELIVWTFVFFAEQSGQRMPTGVVVMQSGQIGFPQFEQDTPVSRLGWR
jgi:hypothetical protein